MEEGKVLYSEETSEWMTIWYWKKILKDKMGTEAKIQFLCIKSSLPTDYLSFTETWEVQ